MCGMCTFTHLQKEVQAKLLHVYVHVRTVCMFGQLELQKFKIFTEVHSLT